MCFGFGNTPSLTIRKKVDVPIPRYAAARSARSSRGGYESASCNLVGPTELHSDIRVWARSRRLLRQLAFRAEVQKARGLEGLAREPMRGDGHDWPRASRMSAIAIGIFC